jgi:hypothetical protein
MPCHAQGSEAQPLLQQDLLIEEPGFTGTLLISSCLALLSTFINGFNTGVMNGVEVR